MSQRLLFYKSGLKKSFFSLLSFLFLVFIYFNMEDEKKIKDVGLTTDITSELPFEEGAQHDDEQAEPTEEDWKNLREVADKVPTSAFLIILIEFCERFTYYGLTGPLQNFIQQPPPPSCKFLFFYFKNDLLHLILFFFGVTPLPRSCCCAWCFGERSTNCHCIDDFFQLLVLLQSIYRVGH